LRDHEYLIWLYAFYFLHLQVAELQKQILEERQIQELRQLQAASGMAVKNLDSTMDWMYEGPSAQQQQSAEEFLLGKVYKPPAEGAGSSATPSNVPQSCKPHSMIIHYLLNISHIVCMCASPPKCSILRAARAPVAALAFSKNEAFTRLHEDPLLAIRQQEKSVSTVLYS
jgi:hypothetical protein